MRAWDASAQDSTTLPWSEIFLLMDATKQGELTLLKESDTHMMQIHNAELFSLKLCAVSRLLKRAVVSAEGERWYRGHDLAKQL
jgi:hypothetical protein